MQDLNAASILIPAVAGLLGVALGGWLSVRRDRTQRRLAFIESQLEGFYSPMLGLRNEVRAASELRVKIQAVADSAWQELCAAIPKGDFEATQRLTTERGPQFTKLIEYDNNQLHEALLPAYRKMAGLFREKYWLADPQAHELYPLLVEYVDLWNRWTDRSLPAEVFLKLEHSEQKLQPLYEHIESTHRSLRRQLRIGAPD